MDTLGDTPERAGYIAPHNAALSALERRLADDGPLFAAVDAVNVRLKPARDEAEAEISRRYHAAAEREAARQEAAERRKAAERRTGAIAEADAALAVLAKAMPEVGVAPAAAGLAA